MWPTLLDMSKDDCRKSLRSLELEAYSNMVDVLRAQGHFNTEKKKLLSEVATALNIPLERHKAEVRRAVNDEKLNSIAEVLVGPNTCAEWAIEGRRLIPLLPRPKIDTVFSVIADECADYVASHKDIRVSEGAHKPAGRPDFPFQMEPSSPEASKTQTRSSSPSGVLVFPSGAAIEMRREEEQDGEKKRRRAPQEPPSSPHPKNQQPMGVSSRNVQGVAMPLKLSLHNSGVRTANPSQAHAFSTPPKQVIIVSSQANPPPSILHKQLSVPSKMAAGKSTIMYSHATPATPEGFKQRPKSMQSTPVAKPRGNTIVMAQKTPLKTLVGGPKGMPMHTKIVVQQPGKQLQRAMAKPHQHHVVLQKPGKQPIVTNLQVKSAQGVSSVPLQMRGGSKPVQLKEAGGGMKMVSISSSGSGGGGGGGGGAKLLPKPSQPVYMVTSAPLTMVTRTPTGSAPRVMTVTSSGQPVKWTSSTAGGKPVQTMVVTQQRRPDGGVVLLHKSHPANNLVSVKESFKSTPKVQKPLATSSIAHSLQQLSSSQTQGSPLILLDLGSQQEKSNNSSLSDLLQASAVVGDGEVKPAILVDSTSTSNSENKQASEPARDDAHPVTAMSIEEAVELLNRSDTPETRALLSQAGIQISDEIADSEEDEQAVEKTVPSQQQAILVKEQMEVKVEGAETADEMVAEPKNIGKVTAVTAAVATPTISTRPRDIYGTALASADINLDSFMEDEDEPEPTPVKDDSKLADTKGEETDSAPDSSADPLELELGELTGVSSR